ncbi:MAG: histidine kinase, partial [Cyanobacteria bacterium P01_E01_bin.35]
MKFQLEIQQIEQICLFKLGWGKGQQISTIVPYPDDLSQRYQTWHRAYLGFYTTALRARVPKPKNQQGQINLPQDHHRQMVQAEAELLTGFQRWLRREEL